MTEKEEEMKRERKRRVRRRIKTKKGIFRPSIMPKQTHARKKKEKKKKKKKKKEEKTDPRDENLFRGLWENDPFYLILFMH